MIRLHCRPATLPTFTIMLLATTLGNVRAETPPTTDSVVVKLLNAGQTPRRILRYVPEMGSVQKAVMTTKMEMQTTANGLQQPAMKIPAQEITMMITVDNVDESGDIHFRFRYEDLQVIDDPENPSPMAAMLKRTLQPLVGMKGKGVVDSRGFTTSMDITIPDDTPDMMKQILTGMKDMFNHLSSPVPAEAVGVGAKWQVTQPIKANGMELTQISTHELTEMNQDGFTVQADLVQTGKPQPVANPNLPPGVKITLNSLDTEGDGKSELKLGLMLPTSAKVRIVSKSDMTIEAAGQNQKIATETNMNMSIRPE